MLPRWKFVLLWSGRFVSARLIACCRSYFSLPIPFLYAIYTASNIHGSFKYNTLSNYATLIVIHNVYKNQISQRFQWNWVSISIFSWKFVAYQLLQFSQVSCTNKRQVEKIKRLEQCSSVGKFITSSVLWLPCSYCDLYSLQKSNLQMFAVELLFHEMFFLSHS